MYESLIWELIYFCVRVTDSICMQYNLLKYTKRFSYDGFLSRLITTNDDRFHVASGFILCCCNLGQYTCILFYFALFFVLLIFGNCEFRYCYRIFQLSYAFNICRYNYYSVSIFYCCPSGTLLCALFETYFTSSCLQEGSCLVYGFCVCLRGWCPTHTALCFCFVCPCLVSCVSYVASCSGLSILDFPFGFL